MHCNSLADAYAREWSVLKLGHYVEVDSILTLYRKENQKVKSGGINLDGHDLFLIGLYLIGLANVLEKPTWYNITFTGLILLAHVLKIYFEPEDKS